MESVPSSPKPSVSKLRRWSKRLFLTALVLGLSLRASVGLVLPGIIDGFAESRGLRIHYENLDFSIFSGSLELWKLEVRKAPTGSAGGSASEEDEEGELITLLEFLTADVEVSALLRGELIVHRAEIDGLDVYASRESLEQGWSLASALPTQAEDDPETEELEDEVTPGEPQEFTGYDLSLPLELRAVRLQHLQLHLSDSARTPAFKTRLELNVRLTDLGLKRSPARIEVYAHGTHWLDTLEVDGKFRSQGTNLSAQLACQLGGLHIGRLGSYLEPLGLHPKAESLDMGMTCDVQIKGVDGGNQALTMEASVRDIELLADGEQCFAIDELSLNLPRIAPDGIQVETSTLRGLRVNAERGANGLLYVAGLEIVGAPSPGASPDSAGAPQEAAPAIADSATQGRDRPSSEAQPFSLHIAALRLEDGVFSFTDRSFLEPQELRWIIQSAELADIRLEPGHSIALRAQMSSPGVLEDLRVHGQLVPLGPQKTVELELAVAGIEPSRVQPYLAAMGLQSTFKAGSFGAKLVAQLEEDADGRLQADLQVKDILLSDRSELFAIDQLRLKGLRYDPLDGSLHLAEVLWDGTRVSVRRDAQRELHFFGIATGSAQGALVARAPAPRRPASPRAQAPSSAQPVTPTGSAPASNGQPTSPARTPLPRITIERIAWTNTAFHFLDESFSPARRLDLQNLGFELRGLDLGGQPSSQARPPAGFKLMFQAEGLAQELECSGTLQAQPGILDVSLAATCRGREMSYAALSPWLAEIGIESVVRHGELDLRFSARIAQTDSGFEGDLELADLRFAEGEATFLALDEFKLASWKWNQQGLQNEGILVRGPRIALERDAQGALLALGLRVPSAESRSKSSTSAKSGFAGATPAQVQPAASASEVAAEPPVPAAAAEPMTFALGTLSLTDAQVLWKDAAVPGGLESALKLDAKVTQLTFGPGAQPSPFEVSLGAAGGLGEMTMTGELGLAPERVLLASDINAEHIRAGLFAAYLPAGLNVPIADGRMEAKLNAYFEPRPDGDGFAFGLGLGAVDYRDAGDLHPLLALADMKLSAARIDPAEAHYAIDEVRLSGLEIDTRRAADGSLRLLGIALGGPSPADSERVEPAPEEAPDLAQVQDRQSTNSEPAEQAPVPSNDPSQPSKVPTVSIGVLDVGIAHLRFLDESASGAQPFDGSLRLSFEQPTTLIAPEAADLPPLEFHIDGFATPLMQTLAAKIVVSPFAQEPGLGVEFEASGLRGLGITEVLPELEEFLDGSEVEGGRFEAAFQGHLNLRRRSPVDFDLSTGFGLEFDIDRLSYVPQEGAPELLALKHLNASVKSIRPRSGTVHVERIELVEPKMHIVKSEEGIHLLGLILKLPTAENSEDSVVAEDKALADTPQEAAPQAIHGDTLAALEEGPAQFRLDQFLISGADLSFVDHSVKPAMHLPVTDLELELKRFSTRTLTNPEPFRFRVALYGGDVQLPKRQVSGSLLGGIIGSVGSLLDSEDDKPMEARPVFDEILLRGNMSLGPQPNGWTQLRVRALELPTFAGPALESGIDIGDGLLNETAMLHFDGEGGVRISSQTNISYLSLSEPADGPISSYLKLPAPIDTVLFVLRDEKGDQNIPLNIAIDEGGVSAGAILAAVGQTLGLIIGDAIASSPMKIIGGVLDLAGLDEEPLELNGDEIVRLAFQPGDVQAPRSMRADLAPLLVLLRSDPSLYLVVTHELSERDLACCDVLANPPAKECLGLAERLRGKRVQLLARRAEQAAAVRGAYAMGDLPAADQNRAHLRQLDLELGATESALDRVYELTRPGAERGRARRARDAALELAGRRMEAVTRELLKAAISGIGTRVDARRPRFGVLPELEQGTIQISVHRRL